MTVLVLDRPELIARAAALEAAQANREVPVEQARVMQPENRIPAETQPRLERSEELLERESSGLALMV
ncbi:hypothetical protein SAMN05216203_3117 [Marinobacter daqiaonensis]|uniref:Uncharacterized protein n=1 Tax=Marinobacter daqiaonensis TaxID=650891 RepID=A0A1I6JPJ2_9GAMM|nr:hypothetical protein [Marinobacter daqiaonensis]SFR80821.1 hypothetical protein SAMN05216203_3117 [Marinobacter daqiaonensis]